ncbi:YceD family protein [Nakamurella sp.]|uniref:YceD family protein n=1 Tax=Nakamurella sp. TaxID=1869182 RepID=UPI00378493B2
MPAVPAPRHNSPWVIDTRTLGRRPGTMRTLRIAVPLDAPMGLDVLAVPAGAEVDLDLRLESVAEGVLVSGTAAATAVGQCSRCLIEVTEPVVAGIRELFAYPDSATAATTEEDEIPLVLDDRIDLEQVVRDEIVTALPMAPVCRPDCRGLCIQCGGRFDDLEPDHSHEILDPRWAALRDRLATETPESTGRPPAGPGE